MKIIKAIINKGQKIYKKEKYNSISSIKHEHCNPSININIVNPAEN